MTVNFYREPASTNHGAAGARQPGPTGPDAASLCKEKHALRNGRLPVSPTTLQKGFPPRITV
ncbi:protein of unknown function (plasmid) [Azospirillum lipoferum 4B]|uniref:Uncharacterized protein n=1 Tax=Azospirillum lipoferum (strain 4B) TaxID=862719 RepID=G7ZIT3_AZOL4|nr:protein of unknown function [Azospirillum lipoferum 4B]